MTDAQFFVVGYQGVTRKLSPIVGYYGVWNAESADDIVPYEPLDFSCRDCCPGFGLNLFCEVIDSN